MKNKTPLILLLFLPFLGGCFAWDNYGEYGAIFRVVEFDVSDEITFPLSSGIVLNIEYGLYNKDKEKIPSNYAELNYMILVGHGRNSQEFECLYVVDDPFEECYWTYDRLNDSVKYNKRASITIGSEYFTEAKGYLNLVLGYYYGSKPEKTIYSVNEITRKSGGNHGYTISDSVLTLQK